MADELKQFMTTFTRHVDGSRLTKAKAMLRADRFQLFIDIDDKALTGVVKSQTDAGLLYSCRVTKDGDFACCTQNLNVCGGLRGAVCKHIIVLLCGLVQTGQLTPDKAVAWTQATKSKRPVLDRDLMSEAFIKYKGAEAGEVDWRPTETLPEDYYAL